MTPHETNASEKPDRAAEIEITSEMIEAGMAAYREWQTETIRPTGMDRPRQLVQKLILAVFPLACRRK